jgi:dTDP-4-amino-4,6-dideoxygalactose transaminase
VGGNAKMNEFQAAMGLCNLRRIDREIARRGEICALYEELLAGKVQFLAPQPGVTANHAYMPVFFRDKAQRDHVFESLKRQEIYARKYFYPLITDFECYRGRPGFDSAATPVAAQLAATVLTLPLYPELTDDEVRRVCAAIREALA